MNSSSSASSSSSSVPIEAIRSYHATERRLFARMVLDLSLDPFRAMEIIAFWLWLSEIGHPDVIRKAQSLTGVSLLLVAGVAEAFIDALRLEPSDHFRPNADLRHAAIHGISYYLSSVCLKAFDDIQRQAQLLHMDRLLDQMSHLHIPRGEGTSSSSSSSTARSLLSQSSQDLDRAIRFRQELNLLFGTPINSGISNLSSASLHRRHPPLPPPPPAQLIPDLTHQMNSTARPYHPLSTINCPPRHHRSFHRTEQMERDQRTLFVTFSNGYPLTEEDLYVFFMRYVFRWIAHLSWYCFHFWL
ncbi:hypothetical protein IHE45_05G039800 [Dioscorea alata]|uniref:Uncharacterized protein n=1 Tax=Dioscorea alata TaxID=55571 RepID=A0ACB7W130_DIOAL|nr:hypothetical protein IHE45_05G039800 [Dioscorea alata]